MSVAKKVETVRDIDIGLLAHLGPRQSSSIILSRRGKYVAWGIGLIVVAIVLLLRARERKALYSLQSVEWDWVAIGIAVAVVGLLILAREVYRYRMPEPALLVLSPGGIAMSMDGTVSIMVPWSQVIEVTRVDVKTKNELPLDVETSNGVFEHEIRENYKDVTAVAVTQDFYDRSLAPAYKDMKRNTNTGFGKALGLVDGMVHHIAGRDGSKTTWSSLFIRRGDEMLVALHHRPPAVSARRLHTEVIARWQTFGGRGRRSSAGPLPNVESGQRTSAGER
jgi:hypothetical protein